MTFDAYERSLELLRALAPLLARLAVLDDNLASQARRAATSVALNVAEAGGRIGGDKLHHVRIALGSLREVGAVLDIAAAHGWLAAPPMAAERDRLGALLYGLQRR